jgi:hypothetical protein
MIPRRGLDFVEISTIITRFLLYPIIPFSGGLVQPENQPGMSLLIKEGYLEKKKPGIPKSDTFKGR